MKGNEVVRELNGKECVSFIEESNLLNKLIDHKCSLTLNVETSLTSSQNSHTNR
jgi:hypothetical protein